MIKKNLLIIGLLAGTALAQTTPAPAKTTTPATATKPAAATPAKTPAAVPATKPATTAAATKTTQAASKPASQAVKPAAKQTPVVAKKPATAAKPKAATLTPTAKKAMAKAEAKAKAPKPVAKKQDVATVVKTAGRRDPFISPVRLQEDRMKNTSVCTTGARCLIIDQVVLKGVVKTTSGMIAMVENAAKKQYNLKEKDPVFNGFVLKISGDSVVFRETITDNLGNQTAKEVVKRVTAPVI
jgi:Tfp pilus assembly protein PilP